MQIAETRKMYQIASKTDFYDIHRILLMFVEIFWCVF